MTIPLIILAAGRGARMQMDGKLMTDLGGKPMIDHVFKAAQASMCRPIYLVKRSEQVFSHLQGAQQIIAADAHLGQSHSLRAGLGALSKDAQGGLICLGDTPFLSTQAINHVSNAATESPTKIIRLTYANTPGHPVYLPKWLFGGLDMLSGDMTAASLLKSHKSEIVELPWADDSVTFDVDTPEQLLEARRRVQSSAEETQS